MLAVITNVTAITSSGEKTYYRDGEHECPIHEA